MHIAICDDNIADRKQMERLLGRAADRRKTDAEGFYIDSFGNVEAVMHAPMLYDVFFIDMTTGPVNGFQLARSLIDGGATSPIVLCISTIDYRAIIESAIEKEPTDREEKANHEILRRQLQTQIQFLDKPIKVEELEKALDDATVKKEAAIPTIELRGEEETLYVYEDEIMYAKRQSQYVHVTLTEGREIKMLSTMRNFYAHLVEFPHFMPISEHTLVNVLFIEKIAMLKLHMTDGTVLSASPFEMKYIKEAREQVKNTENT